MTLGVWIDIEPATGLYAVCRGEEPREIADDDPRHGATALVMELSEDRRAAVVPLGDGEEAIVRVDRDRGWRALAAAALVYAEAVER